jgi:ribosomal protein S15P/S13E
MIDVRMNHDELRTILFALSIDHETLVEHLESEPDDEKSKKDLVLVEQVAAKIHKAITSLGV